MRTRRISKGLLGLLVWGMAGLASAASPVPPELQGWQGWVLEGETARQCALKNGATGQGLDDYLCMATTDLVLSPEGAGIAFSVRIKTDRSTAVPLPGQEQQWPQNIRMDGQPAVLRRQGDQWLVVVPAGEHLVQGRWAEAFEKIPVPAQFPRVIWGPENRLLVRDAGQAWIRAKAVTAVEAEEAEAPPAASVWRYVTDGQALSLTTQVQLRLSGAVQRVEMGPALPAGFRATAWESSVPAVVTPEGTLVVQAGRGTHTVVIQARCDKECLPNTQGVVPPSALALKPVTAPWPTHETWSIQANPAFRQLTVDGQGVDPAAADVPMEWRSAPAFRVSSNSPLALKSSSRGRQPGEGETLSLQRETWLENGHWTNWDHLQGVLPVGGRLAMQKPFVLGRVQDAGQQPLPLSVDAAGDIGLEWGQPHVEVWAQSTQPTGKAPTTGWNATMDGMQVTMHLPPGTTLLAAPGASEGNGAWVDRFTLLSFFGIALLSLLVRQALGTTAAVVAAVLAAGWVGHGGVLWLLWWIALATSFYLAAQTMPAGRLQHVTRILQWTTWCIFVVAWIPFAGNQARLALHPQLPDRHASVTSVSVADRIHGQVETSNSLDESVYGDIGEQVAAPKAAMVPTAPPPAPVTRAQPVMGAPDTRNAVDGNDPLAGIGLANVGQPLPAWHASGLGRTYHLNYQGPLRPMSKENSYTGVGSPGMQRVWVAPAWSVQILRALGTLALAWLALRLFVRFCPQSLDHLPQRPARWAHRLGLALLLVPGLAWSQSPSSLVPDAGPSLVVSNAPDPRLLAELKQRLTQPPACAPACVSLVGADLSATGDGIVVTYRVSVEHASGWELPAVSGAQLVGAQVDGSPAWFASESVVVLSPGQSRVVARYRPLASSVAIDFPSPPLEVSEQLQGWSSAGTLGTGTWAIERGPTVDEKKAAAADNLPAGVAVPGYVQVTRTLVLGATATVTTVVERLPGSQGALMVNVPALTGESVENEKVERKGEDWRVSLPAGQDRVTWNSRLVLPPNGEIVFTPIAAAQGQETWHLVKGPAWTLALSGVPESMPQENAWGVQRQILPLAGETLRAVAVRLPAAPGEQQRVDRVSLDTTVGPQDAQHTLSFDVVTAQAGERTLVLPAGSEVVSVLRNGQRLSLPLNGNRLVVPVQRGVQTVVIEFRSPSGKARLSTPAVDLGGPVSNVTYKLSHAKQRWVMWTSGPGWGTAVLYWSQLIVLLVVAWGLTKLPGRLFSLPVAVLLVLGFSTFYFTVVWLVALVAWQAWVGWRARSAFSLSPPLFNLQQVALAAFTGLTVLAMTGAIAFGLLGAQPDMMLRAPSGLGLMEWVVSQAPAGPLEGPVVISLPMWVYQALLFAWALWFAAWLLQAVKRALMAWLSGGYWRKKAVASVPPQEPVEGPAGSSPPPVPQQEKTP